MDNIKPIQEYLVGYNGGVYDTTNNKWMDSISILISSNGKLVAEVEDHDGYTWYKGYPLESIINSLEIENVLYIGELIEKRLRKEAKQYGF